MSVNEVFTNGLEAASWEIGPSVVLVFVFLSVNVVVLLLAGILGRQYGTLPITVLSTTAQAMAALAKVRH